jgi:hypothetical protein
MAVKRIDTTPLTPYTQKGFITVLESEPLLQQREMKV